MNVGQILETHLGWAAKGLGHKIGELLRAKKKLLVFVVTYPRYTTTVVSQKTSIHCVMKKLPSLPQTLGTACRSRRQFLMVPPKPR